MKTAIWKFPLALRPRQTISIPAKSKGLAMQLQNGVPTLWALCPVDNQAQTMTVVYYFTGDELPNIAQTYLGTTQHVESGLVRHWFMLT